MCIKIRVLSRTGSLAFYKSNFHEVHYIGGYLRDAIYAKIYVQRENIYIHSIFGTVLEKNKNYVLVCGLLCSYSSL